MRKIDKFEKVNEENFKRVVGVKRATFKVMVEEYKKAEKERKKGHKIGGRKPKLCEEDRVLFMLEYYREYRTLYYMGIDYGISEGQASKVVRDVERVLYEADNEIEFIIIDATESPIQRPKKSKSTIIQGKRNNIH